MLISEMEVSPTVYPSGMLLNIIGIFTLATYSPLSETDPHKMREKRTINIIVTAFVFIAKKKLHDCGVFYKEKLFTAIDQNSLLIRPL